ncbi:hypothetical protein LIER_15876 [Lithospermum erythrorhizon]|uniref:Uncharacterized protein n=1 Tax=Lithospermum erythrorhizon TaxID=34254 RepID=A0AAV3Q647_LITER
MADGETPLSSPPLEDDVNKLLLQSNSQTSYAKILQGPNIHCRMEIEGQDDVHLKPISRQTLYYLQSLREIQFIGQNKICAGGEILPWASTNGKN